MEKPKIACLCLLLSGFFTACGQSTEVRCAGRSAKQMSNADGYTAHVDFLFRGESDSGTTGFRLEQVSDIHVWNNPYMVYLTGSRNVTMGAESLSLNFEGYRWQNNDHIQYATRTDGQDWDKGQDDAKGYYSDVYTGELLRDIADQKIEAKNNEVVQNNRTYLALTCSIPAKQGIEDIMQYLGETGVPDTLEIKPKENTAIPTTLYIDKKSGNPVKAEYDLTDAVQITETDEGEQYSCGQLTLDITWSQFGTTEPVELPDGFVSSNFF